MPPMTMHDPDLCQRCRDLEEMWKASPSVATAFIKARRSPLEYDHDRAIEILEVLVAIAGVEFEHHLADMPPHARGSLALADIGRAEEDLMVRLRDEVRSSTTKGNERSILDSCEADEFAGRTHYESGYRLIADRLLTRCHNLAKGTKTSPQPDSTVLDRARTADTKAVLDRLEIAEEVAAAVEQLPEQHRTTIKSILEGQTQADIAKSRSISPATVSREVREAKQMLARILRQDD